MSVSNWLVVYTSCVKSVAVKLNKSVKFVFNIYYGAVAEWLGRGLQNLLHWFESSQHL